MLQNLQEAHNTAAAAAAAAAVVALAVAVAVAEVHDIVADYHLRDLHAHGHFLFALQNGRVSFDLPILQALSTMLTANKLLQISP